MSNICKEPPINPYEPNYAGSYQQYHMPNSQQNNPQWSQQQDLPIYIANNSDSNIINQPLIDSNESLDSFSEMIPRQNNQTGNCEIPPCVKYFIIIELICDLIGLLAYFLI